MNAAGKESDEIVMLFQFKRDTNQFGHVCSEGFGVVALLLLAPLTPVCKPDTINDGMQNLPTVPLRLFNGGQQNVAGPSANGLMGFNTSKTGVAVSCVTKACDQQPLQSVLPEVKRVPLGCSLKFELSTTFDNGGHDPSEKSVAASAGMTGQARDPHGVFMGQGKQTV